MDGIDSSVPADGNPNSHMNGAVQRHCGLAIPLASMPAILVRDTLTRIAQQHHHSVRSRFSDFHVVEYDPECTEEKTYLALNLVDMKDG